MSFNWLKTTELFWGKNRGKSARPPEEDDDDDDLPGPSAGATVGWLPFLKPRGFAQPQLA
jgi:hypothetical protein